MLFLAACIVGAVIANEQLASRNLRAEPSAVSVSHHATELKMPGDDPHAIATKYLSFGATAADPSAKDCKVWAALYNNKDGTSCAPGAPCAVGEEQLVKLCGEILDSFGVFYCVPTQVQPVYIDGKLTSLAFKWELVGTEQPTGALTAVPSISTITFDEVGKFKMTQDYFAPQVPVDRRALTATSPSSPTSTEAAPQKAEDIVAQYALLGATAAAPLAFDCHKYASLYAEDGKMCGPGGPCAIGHDAIVTTCEGYKQVFKDFFMVPTQVQPIYRDDGRTVASVAFASLIRATWRSSGELVAAPALSTMVLSNDGKITSSQDYMACGDGVAHGFDAHFCPP